MAKGPNQETFLADTERHLRDCVSKNPNLVCWRGVYPHKSGGMEFRYDTIVVGMTDDKESKEPPPLVVMKVWLPPAGGACIDYSVGSADDTYQCTPFGGGWVPINEVKKLSEKLAGL